jgi:hypothetical protein
LTVEPPQNAVRHSVENELSCERRDTAAAPPGHRHQQRQRQTHHQGERGYDAGGERAFALIETPARTQALSVEIKALVDGIRTMRDGKRLANPPG